MAFNLIDYIISITGIEQNRFGTGFVIHQDGPGTYLLTCMHVVNDIGGPEQLSVDNNPAILVAFDPEDGFDLAVLYIKKSLGIPRLKLSSSGSVNSSFITAGSYSFGKQRMLQQVRGVLVEEAKIESKRLGQRCTAWHLEITGDYLLQPGYSGAPVVDIANKEAPRVLGFINYRRGEGKTGLAISIESLSMVWPNMPRELIDELEVDQANVPERKEFHPTTSSALDNFQRSPTETPEVHTLPKFKLSYQTEDSRIREDIHKDSVDVNLSAKEAAQNYIKSMKPIPPTIPQFYMAPHLVSNSLYTHFVSENSLWKPGSDGCNGRGDVNHTYLKDWINGQPPDGSWNLPVTSICFRAAKAFAAWLSQYADYEISLPTYEHWHLAVAANRDEDKWLDQEIHEMRVNYFEPIMRN